MVERLAKFRFSGVDCVQIILVLLNSIRSSLKSGHRRNLPSDATPVSRHSDPLQQIATICFTCTASLRAVLRCVHLTPLEDNSRPESATHVRRAQVLQAEECVSFFVLLR